MRQFEMYLHSLYKLFTGHWHRKFCYAVGYADIELR